MDNKELGAEIKRLKSKNLPYPVLACQRHLRWALAVTPLLFVGLGIPLAIGVHRGGRSIGFGLSLLIMVLYYVMVMGGTAAGQRGLLPPWFAVWLADGLILTASGILYARFLKR